jgi:hypothetical protein
VSSILASIKKALGVGEDDSFDPEIILHINSVLSTLNQLGVGPAQGFQIEDEAATWESFLGDDPRLNNVKTYVYAKVRLVFDPPSTSFTIQAFKDIASEAEFRISTTREVDKWEQTSTTLLRQ